MKPLAVLVEAALAGGSVLKGYFGGDFRISFKGAVNLVTDADLASETEVVGILKRRFPGCGIPAEEAGEESGDSGLLFIIDPLDGTTNFAHGYPVFAVSVACEEAAEVTAGAV